jgi:hypothetical protein
MRGATVAEDTTTFSAVVLPLERIKLRATHLAVADFTVEQPTWGRVNKVSSCCAVHHFSVEHDLKLNKT